MKLTIQKATNSETRAKIDAAMKNGYLKYDNLSKGKKRELIHIMAVVLSTCSPTIMEYVMKCQMGMIDAAFFELKDGTPVKMYTLVWMYKFFKQQVEIAKANGVTVQPVEEPIILLILCCVPVYSYYMLCDIYNKNVDATAPRFA